jgi:protein-tyrosine phosphatase
LTGRIDVHSHLIPGVDDGCATIEDSIECARQLCDVGYTHCFCTPHIWPTLPQNTITQITAWTIKLQEHLDRAKVPLQLIPGGENNLRAELEKIPADEIVTYAMNRSYVLIDLWAEKLPLFFGRTVRWLQSHGLTVILAHPERMRAVQDDPSIADKFAEMGLLLQGNLQCFSDPPGAHTRRVAEKYLLEGRYFLLGSDTHRPDGLAARIKGLNWAIKLVGDKVVDRLTIENARSLLPMSEAPSKKKKKSDLIDGVDLDVRR